MNGIELLISFIAGLVIGAGIVILITTLQNSNHGSELKNELMSKNAELQRSSLEELVRRANETMKGQTALQNQELNSKKELIDQQLNQMNTKLSTVTALIQEFETSRAEKIGALDKQLSHLTQTTGKLQEVLANNRERGQWGERIAEDLLKTAGFIENINYTKQTTVGLEAGRKIRPDFTFNLPNGMLLNMDAKFPLDNYMKYMDAQSDAEKAACKNKFLSDVGKRIKEVVGKEYINTKQNTIDCVLLFIPSEAIYHFLHDCIPTRNLLDEAMKNKVIICSPINLFAVLAVIRHATENYRLEKSSQEILTILKDFRKQWDDYVGKLDDISKQFDKTQSIFNDLMGKRKTTLDKQLAKIDNIEIKATSESTEVPALPELVEA